MKMNKPNYPSKILKVLEQLKRDFPHCNLGRHLATALDEQDLWSLSDKDMFNYLDEYASELSMDKPHEDEELDNIIKGGMNLTSLIYDDEDEDEQE